MNIAILGAGNVGGALATNFSQKGHRIRIGSRDPQQLEAKHLLQNPNTSVHRIAEAVEASDCIVIATPPGAIFSLIDQMGDVAGKTIIDASNRMQASLQGYPTVYHCLADRTKANIVKCFNSTGYENLLNPVYPDGPLDMLMAGDSESAKRFAHQLAMDVGFGHCFDFGGSDKVELLEQFAQSWINLAIIQRMGRKIGFRLLAR